MNLRAFFLLGTVIALALLTGGCVDSVHPLSARAAARPDSRLVGTWRWQGQPGKTSAPDDLVRIAFDARGIGHSEGIDKAGVFRPVPGAFFVTRRGQDCFINDEGPAASPRKGRRANPVLYTIYRYRVSEDGKTVQFWSLKADTMQQAVATGKLHGRITHDKNAFGDDVHLRDAGDKILAFIESRPTVEIFEEGGTLKKVD